MRPLEDPLHRPLVNTLRDAARDLRGQDYRILATIYEELHPIVFIPIKHRWIAGALGIHHATVSRSMARLVAMGYLEIQEGQAGNRGAPHSYRRGHRCTTALLRQAG